MNRVDLVGRITKDPEMSYTNAEQPIAICKFTLAVQRNKDVADFINITAFGKLGETADKYVRKGDFLAVSGKLQQTKWEDKEGNKKSRLDVIADGLTFGPKTRSAEDEFKDDENLPFKF